MGFSRPQSLGILCFHFMAIKHNIQPRRGKPSHTAALKAERVRGQRMAQEQVGDGFALHRAFKGAHLVDGSFPGVGNNSTDSGRGLSGHPEPGTELALPTPSWGWGSQRVRHNGSDLAGMHMEISARDL